MAWNEKTSTERVRHHLEAIQDIEVIPLAREVSDLESLLSETNCREIFGAHVYLAINNFDELTADSTMSRDAYRRLIQATHVYQREITRIVQDRFTGYRVHFQGSKVHVLQYLPVNDAADIAAQATLLLLVLDDFVRNVFNAEYDGYPDWKCGGGGDVGNAIGTRNGKRAERELLFIGPPANRAAKIIVDRSSLRITKELRDAAPADVQACCKLLADGNYKISASQATLNDLCAAHGIDWDREASASRLAQDRERFPLSEIDYSDANVAVDFSGLSWKNNKRVLSANLFADVSGFTAFVAEAEDGKAKEDALRVFHVIRKELTKVASTDYDGVRVQFQGDRIQTILHLPKGDEATIAIDAVETAISMQSSFEQVIKRECPEAEPLTLKVGIDVGTTLLTRLGTHGDRDNICLGLAVEEAAMIEERIPGGAIGISQAIHDALAESELQKHFSYDESAECWIAEGLTWEKIDALDDQESYREKLLSIGIAGAVVAAGAAAVAYAVSKPTEKVEGPVVEPSRTYGD